MDITEICKHKEVIASNVHEAWLKEKKAQGFHAPIDCVCEDAKKESAIELESDGYWKRNRFVKFCDKCHADMYPYVELSEDVKEYDRVTVDAVLDAISKI